MSATVSTRPRKRGRRRPSAAQRAVTARYGRGVRLGDSRPQGGRRVRIDGVSKEITASMWVTESNTLMFDSTPPAVRRKELAAASRLEAAGKTRVAEKIRNRVAPEEIADAVALRVLLSVTSQLAVAKSRLRQNGHKPFWHRHYTRGADYGVLTVQAGRFRIRGGTSTDGRPWWAVDEGAGHGRPMHTLDVVSKV